MNKIPLTGKGEHPLVTIICVTYNHVQFIRETLNGFLMQQTPFPFEILIHDDASDDGTAAVIREYSCRYPELFVPILQEENQYRKGNKPFTGYFFPRARGKYIAMCEGDDAWTDPLKLKKQIEFLESNPDFSICHHNVKVVYTDHPEKDRLWNSPGQPEVTTIKDLARSNYIASPSCVFRNNFDKIDFSWFREAPTGDYFLHMENARFGKIRYFQEVMGLYRIHGNNLWETGDRSLILDQLLEIYSLMLPHYEEDIREILKETRFKILLEQLEHHRDHPEQFNHYTRMLLESDPAPLFDYLKKNLDLARDLEGALKRVYNSWSYRLGHLLISPLYRIGQSLRFKSTK